MFVRKLFEIYNIKCADKTVSNTVCNKTNKKLKVAFLKTIKFIKIKLPALYSRNKLIVINLKAKISIYNKHFFVAH